MSNVVKLADHRKPQTNAVKKQPCPTDRGFFCLTCDTDAFKLYATGAIHCLNCGARIRNLTVTE